MSERFDYEAARFGIRAETPGSWRTYDPTDPDPGYFEFDWLSARHPDLYHAFALSTEGLMRELRGLVDLTGFLVCDVGAGTGRSAMGAAATARHVIAVDAYDSVVRFGVAAASRAGLPNVSYVQGDKSHLPIRDESIDAVTCSWAEIDFAEAFRVVKDQGWIILMACPPGGLGGELSAVLARDFPELVTEVGPSEWLEPDCPPEDSVERGVAELFGIGVVDDVMYVHDFTYVGQYESHAELAAIVARIYGPRAATYIADRGGSTLTWRQRILYFRVAK